MPLSLLASRVIIEYTVCFIAQLHTFQSLYKYRTHFVEVFVAFSVFPFSFLASVLLLFSQRLLAFYCRDWHSCALHERERENSANRPFPSTLLSTARCDGENARLRPVRMCISPLKFKLCIRGNALSNYSNNF